MFAFGGGVTNDDEAFEKLDYFGVRAQKLWFGGYSELYTYTPKMFFEGTV